jgi:hypothetical protein
VRYKRVARGSEWECYRNIMICMGYDYHDDDGIMLWIRLKILIATRPPSVVRYKS